jgi:c(7)-type cytochrome triheme protein
LAVCAATTAAAPLQANELGDIPFARSQGAEQFAPAYFPHWVHRLRYKCYACHDGLFAMQRGANPTMAAMARGESCGTCHNGKEAFAVDMCQRCHVRP